MARLVERLVVEVVRVALGRLPEAEELSRRCALLLSRGMSRAAARASRVRQ